MVGIPPAGIASREPEIQDQLLGAADPDAGHRGEGVDVLGCDCGAQSLGAERAEDGQCQLGADAAGGDEVAEHSAAVLLGKAEQRHLILADVQVGVDDHIFA